MQQLHLTELNVEQRFVCQGIMLIAAQSVYTYLCLQEEGWLMGIKESTGEKGMFPANFTRPL
jgi:hypothetical protein